MVTHPSGLFSRDYISALRGCWSLKFLHTLQPPKIHLTSDVGRRAASNWALPIFLGSFCFTRFILFATGSRCSVGLETSSRDHYLGALSNAGTKIREDVP